MSPANRRPRALRPELCRRYAQKELARGLPGILQRFIDEAQKGSIPHAKALMSLAGLEKDHAVQVTQTKRPKSLSEMLLRELRGRPGTRAEVETKQAVTMRDAELREE